MVSYNTLYRRFNRDSDKGMFHELNGEGVSDIERYLRFIYAVENAERYLKNTHTMSRVKLPYFEFGNEKTKFEFWIPNKGRSYLLTTKITKSPLHITWIRPFREEPLYKVFKREVSHPTSSLELIIESGLEINREFDKIVKIFENACNDGQWEAKLPRLLDKL